jgi:hypothetical protein
MSKKIRALLLLTAVSSLLITTIHTAAQRKSAAVAAVDPKSAAIVATTASVLKETSELRELSVLRAVPSGAQSRADIERMLVRNLDEQTTEAESHATEQSLKKLGMTNSDFHFRSFLVKLLAEQVAGYYDPKQRRFFLADWLDLESQKPAMVHELTHALQDQHFDLRRFEKWPKGDADAELAAHSLVEGDAMLAMELYLAKHPLVALAFIRSMGATGSNERFEGAPRIIRESLIFPYQQGMIWTNALYKKNGWKAVSDAFTELPQSTEQVMHPDKYFAHEAPIKVTLRDVHTLLGARWKRIDENVNGEWGYYLILDQFNKSEADSKRAAAGWGGDRYAVYEGATPNDVFIAAITDWDTANDAREFFEAYAKRTRLRYARENLAELPANSSDRIRWNTSEGSVAVAVKERRVIMLEGIPEGADVNKLLSGL